MQSERIGPWLFYAQRIVAYAFAEVLRQWCEEHDKGVITPPQWNVLSVLHTGDGVTLGTMSQKCGLDAPTMTGIITRLEQHGLVLRQHACDNRRIVKVFLTEEAQEMLRFLPTIVANFEETLVQGIPWEEQKRLLIQLHQIIVNTALAAPDAGDRFGLLLDASIFIEQ